MRRSSGTGSGSFTPVSLRRNKLEVRDIKPDDWEIRYLIGRERLRHESDWKASIASSSRVSPVALCPSLCSPMQVEAKYLTPIEHATFGTEENVSLLHLLEESHRKAVSPRTAYPLRSS